MGLINSSHVQLLLPQQWTYLDIRAWFLCPVSICCRTIDQCWWQHIAVVTCWETGTHWLESLLALKSTSSEVSTRGQCAELIPWHNDLKWERIGLNVSPDLLRGEKIWFSYRCKYFMFRHKTDSKKLLYILFNILTEHFWTTTDLFLVIFQKLFISD